MSSKSYSRIIWADSGKGILIILVILGHAIQTVYDNACFDNKLWCFIYSFHMPCFFAISGMFAKKNIDSIKGLGRLVSRRFLQLYVPMICWQLINNLTPPHLASFNLGIGALFSYLDCGSFWFLFALFYISVFAAFVEFIANKTKIPALILHIVLFLVLMSMVTIFHYKDHGIQYIAYNYPYYIVGQYFLNRFVINKKMVWSCFIIWFVGSFFWKMHEAPFFLKGIPYMPEIFVAYIYRYMVGMAAVFGICGLIAKFVNNESLVATKLSHIGMLSLGIYTSHVVALKIMYFYMKEMCINTWLMSFILFVIATIVSIFTVHCIYKSKKLSLFLLGKIK